MSTDDLSATIEDPKEDGMRSFLSNSNNTLCYISQENLLPVNGYVSLKSQTEFMTVLPSSVVQQREKKELSLMMYLSICRFINRSCGKRKKEKEQEEEEEKQKEKQED